MLALQAEGRSGGSSGRANQGHTAKSEVINDGGDKRDSGVVLCPARY
jgi:hypothetical protein